MNTHFVYMLFDNTLQQPLYVGATIDIKNRFRGHKNTTLLDYKNINNVSIEVLEETDINNVLQTEQYWYNTIKSWGFNLLQKSCRPYRKEYVPISKKTSNVSFNHRLFISNIKTNSCIRKCGVSNSCLNSIYAGSLPDLETFATICKWVDKPMEMFFKKTK